MKKFYSIIILLAICMGAFAQEITVRFSGRVFPSPEYCQLDSVVVTNLTRNWTETIEFPDTIIVLTVIAGISPNVEAMQGLGQNTPNPFHCETRVELSVLQHDDIRMQLLDVSGKLYAEYSATLDAGVHTFQIYADKPQTYILNAVVGGSSYSTRMVNVGKGCGSGIKYIGTSNYIMAKQTSVNEFHLGDNMRYVGYATIDGDIVVSSMTQNLTASQDLILEFMHYTTHGYLNGHEWVDLGLPSGTLWATCNVGAEKPEDYGNYYAWGETTVKETYDWTTYIYCNGNETSMTKYCSDEDFGYYGFVDDLITLEAFDDVASANWGQFWRMPTDLDFVELKNNCDVTDITYNGVLGYLFTGSNGNSIFLPAAGGRYNNEIDDGPVGYYWSGSLCTAFPCKAWNLVLDLGYCHVDAYIRQYGHSVRAVCSPQN